MKIEDLEIQKRTLVSGSNLRVQSLTHEKRIAGLCNRPPDDQITGSVAHSLLRCGNSFLVVGLTIRRADTGCDQVEIRAELLP